jgi:hypothetical protein
VAALALTEPGHDGASYRLTGPEPILPADRVRILAGVLGRDLRLAPLSNAEARERMSESMPGEYVEAFLQLLRRRDLRRLTRPAHRQGTHRAGPAHLCPVGSCPRQRIQLTLRVRRLVEVGRGCRRASCHARFASSMPVPDVLAAGEVANHQVQPPWIRFVRLNRNGPGASQQAPAPGLPRASSEVA